MVPNGNFWNVPNGPTWNSEFYLRTHLLNSYWKPHYRPTGWAAISLAPLYIAGMVTFALSLIPRIIGVAKDLFLFISALFLAGLTCGFCVNKEDIKNRGVALGSGLLEVCTAILGTVCPPLAVYLEEKIQSSLRVVNRTFPWNVIIYSNWADRHGNPLPPPPPPPGPPNGGWGPPPEDVFIGADGIFIAPAAGAGRRPPTVDPRHLSPAQIKSLSPAQVATFSIAHIKELTAQQVGAITNAQRVALSPEQGFALGARESEVIQISLDRENRVKGVAQGLAAFKKTKVEASGALKELNPLHDSLINCEDADFPREVGLMLAIALYDNIDCDFSLYIEPGPNQRFEACKGKLTPYIKSFKTNRGSPKEVRTQFIGLIAAALHNIDYKTFKSEAVPKLGDNLLNFETFMNALLASTKAFIVENKVTAALLAPL